MNDMITKDIPNIIETERLILKAPREIDIEPLYELKLTNREHLKPWFPWVQKDEDFTIEEAKIFIRRQIAHWALRKDFGMCIINKETNELIGMSGIHPRAQDISKRFEIGYWIDHRAEGKGYITESTKALSHFAFDHLDAKSIYIRAIANNKRSRSVPKRLNFDLDGTLRAHEANPVTNEPEDMAIYSVIDRNQLPTCDYKVDFSND